MKPNDRGVIFYNSGWKCLVRVAVAMHSLRKHWDGGCTLVMDGENDESLKIAARICEQNGCELMHTTFKTPTGAKTALLNKTQMDDKTPYKTTVFLDADTVVRQPFLELFDYAMKVDYVVPQFAGWETKGKIRKRIKSWKSVWPQYVKEACEYGPALNCGVYAWQHGSKFMADWYMHALPGRNISRIPDETVMQLLAPQYDFKVASHWFNVSCKYDDPVSDEARIIHYHGNKHCRFRDGLPVNHSNLWYVEFDEIRADEKYYEKIKSLVKSDRMLRKYMPQWDSYKQRRQDDKEGESTI